MGFGEPPGPSRSDTLTPPGGDKPRRSHFVKEFLGRQRQIPQGAQT
jgi:hypothetical protein